MKEDQVSTLVDEIARAHQLAEANDLLAAVRSFDLARRMAYEWVDRKRLKQVTNQQRKNLEREREQYKRINLNHGKRNGNDPILIIGDSLGLPRPARTSTITKGAENTYGWMLGYEVHNLSPIVECQRYFTTDDAVALLQQKPQLTKTKTAIIHLGLNDCANRMFLENERLALSLLEAEVRNQIVGFAQKYRRSILNLLPSRHYVDIQRFRHNLQQIISLLKEGECTRIILTTIILPAVRYWPATPGINANFGRYNQEIMDAAAQEAVYLFDLDRLIWGAGHEELLIDDGMHLSDAGHTFFTREVLKLMS